jgi:hypothetical protein
MKSEHIEELIALLAIGDGVVAFVQPERHSLLWRFGPKPFREAMEAFAENPMLTRLLGAAEAGIGVWLASRQTPR